MGLSSTINRVSYTGDGSSTVFAFPYYFFAPSDLQVYLYDTGSSIVSPQALNTNYTIGGPVNAQGVYPTGGNVLMNSAFPSNLQIIIARSPAQVQNFVLSQNGPINSLGLVQQMDYLTAISQRLQDEVSRCLQLPDGLGTIGGSSVSMVLPQSTPLASSAGQVLALNSGASGWQYVTIPGAGAIVPVAQGGTGQGAALNAWGVVYAVNSTTMADTVSGTPGQVLTANSGAAPSWGSVSLGSGTVSAGSISGILATAQGGTGTGSGFSYTQYGVLYASSTSQFAIVPSVTPGWSLLAQGSAAPMFQQMNLGSSAQFTGVLPVPLGGTGTGTSFIQYGLLFASSATQIADTVQGGINQVITGQGASAPVWQQLSIASGNFIVGSVSMTNQATGVLALPQGGTNMTAITTGQVLYGSGTTQVATTVGGATGQVLSFNGSSAPSWVSAVTNPMTTSADLIVGSGAGVPARLGMGALNQVLSTAAGSTLAWVNPGGNLTVTTLTATGNVSATSDVVLYSSASNGTLTLPSAVSGKLLKIKKIDASAAVCTIVGSNALIDGSSFALIAQNEQVEMICDGTNWRVIDYYHDQVSMRWMAASLSVSGAYQTMGWLSKDYDSFGLMAGSGIFGLGTITINRPGKWDVRIGVENVHTVVAGDGVEVAIFKNGVRVTEQVLESAANMGIVANSVSDTLNLALSDLLTIRLLNQNTSPTIGAGSHASWVALTYLGQ
jgi:hypothetical protein